MSPRDFGDAFVTLALILILVVVVFAPYFSIANTARRNRKRNRLAEWKVTGAQVRVMQTLHPALSMYSSDIVKDVLTAAVHGGIVVPANDDYDDYDDDDPRASFR